jgi:hypothetical protein
VLRRYGKKKGNPLLWGAIALGILGVIVSVIVIGLPHGRGFQGEGSKGANNSQGIRLPHGQDSQGGEGGCDGLIKRLARLRGGQYKIMTFDERERRCMIDVNCPVPTDFSVHELHRMASNRRYDLADFTKCAGCPSKVSPWTSSMDTEIVKSQIWSYQLADGEVRVALMLFDKRRFGGQADIVMSDVEVFRH